ncbi:DUF92 domain-containing protein [Mucilaginibacter sp. 14171R-50]|uniref:DUF92 domain-containing protein n=1 Tax=Mucilaginibacter sp. 14171R-50 TaxID=2703789 RepID=UPI00138D8663|nr:DUF92 domain-containing protein [Mucilaginibacter sp. 14171R-50]QHS57091.1 DUF92 domain-containing protein [Mucilaginibacter sp. 14171R-50]
MLWATVIYLIVLFGAAYASYKTGKLTSGGAVMGIIVAISIYLGTGLKGIAMLAAFFISATIATSHSKGKKPAGSNTHQEKRDATQVLANGGLPALIGLVAFIVPGNGLLAAVLTAAAFASATADTLSSELGTVYGKRFYNIINFRADENGRDGVISLEGTLIGIAGSVVIAALFAASFGLNSTFLYIIIAGTAGNLADSVLGATLEKKRLMNNNEVNFINTVTAAVICCLLIYL